MASVSVVNPKADILRRSAALAANCTAARGLLEILKTNLGPTGTLKMLVGGAGQLRITKDGNVLLNEMQIQHPTAAMIARASTAQDSISGDGTTSTVLLLGTLMRLAEAEISEGVHPRQLCEGFDVARALALEALDSIRVPFQTNDRSTLQSVARTALKTKLVSEVAEQLADIVVDAVEMIRPNPDDASNESQEIDLFRVEILHMKQQFATASRLVSGMVMDHGARHPDMPRRLSNCYVLTCNVSLEYEKTEVNSGFFYSSAEQRDRLVEAERRFTEQKVRQIIELKRQVCTVENKRSFVVFNQKGIDPQSLDLLAKEGILALRRVKRRNMERLTLACGGNALNSVDNMLPEDLGFAGEVYEECIGDEKWTFVEQVANPGSCAILIKGPNDHTIAQIKDAIRDGLRAVKNVLEDGCLVPGAGAFEIAVHAKLTSFLHAMHDNETNAINSYNLTGKARRGVRVFAESILIVPQTLAANAGLDSQECIAALIDEYKRTQRAVGLNLVTGQVVSPTTAGIWDNYRVKRQLLSLAPTLAQQLLLCDEIIRAGKQMTGSQGPSAGALE